ncbi:hypothetical protein BV20DRAFT_157332 [Pilatotrama ljubarskyi]|nr:hypothetical protein BV20DRAFT_157332 [Pilatotrama ljubarskyi]
MVFSHSAAQLGILQSRTSSLLPGWAPSAHQPRMARRVHESAAYVRGAVFVVPTAHRAAISGDERHHEVSRCLGTARESRHVRRRWAFPVFVPPRRGFAARSSSCRPPLAALPPVYHRSQVMSLVGGRDAARPIMIMLYFRVRRRGRTSYVTTAQNHERRPSAAAQDVKNIDGL